MLGDPTPSGRTSPAGSWPRHRPPKATRKHADGWRSGTPTTTSTSPPPSYARTAATPAATTTSEPSGAKPASSRPTSASADSATAPPPNAPRAKRLQGQAPGTGHHGPRDPTHAHAPSGGRRIQQGRVLRPAGSNRRERAPQDRSRPAASSATASPCPATSTSTASRCGSLASPLATTSPCSRSADASPTPAPNRSPPGPTDPWHQATAATERIPVHLTHSGDHIAHGQLAPENRSTVYRGVLL